MLLKPSGKARSKGRVAMVDETIQNPLRKRIALIALPPWRPESPPLSIGYLAAHLSAHDWPVSLYDADYEWFDALSGVQGMQELWMCRYLMQWVGEQYVHETRPLLMPHLLQLADRIAEEDPLVIGVSCHSTYSLSLADDLVCELRRLNPRSIFVAGGPGVSGREAQGFLSRTGFDYLIEGEGEETLLELVEGIAAGSERLHLEQIAGVVPWAARPEGDPYVHFTPRRVMPDPSRFPFPTFDGLDMGRYSVTPLLLGRGCLWRCAFCEEHVRQGRGHRAIVAERVLDAIAFYVGRGSRSFEFCDLSINSDVKNLSRLADLIIESGLDIQWSGNLKICKDMTLPLMLKLREAGLISVNIGIESFSNDVLKIMRKGQDVRITMETLHNAKKAGIRTSLFVLVGFPGETEEHFRETLEGMCSASGLYDSVASVNGMLLADWHEVGRYPKRFGIATRGDSIGWDGPAGNTLEERIDRVSRMVARLSRLDQNFEPHALGDVPDCILVRLPGTGGPPAGSGFLGWSARIVEGLGEIGVQVEVVDLHEVFGRELDGMRVSKHAGPPCGCEDDGAGRLTDQLLHPAGRCRCPGSAALDRCLDRILCSGAPLVVLWVGERDDHLTGRFAKAITQADPGLLVVAAGTGLPPNGRIPASFMGVLLADEIDGIHRIIRRFRAGLQPDRTVDGVYSLADPVAAPRHWSVGVVRLVGIEFLTGDGQSAVSLQPGDVYQMRLTLQFQRAGRSLKFQIRLHAPAVSHEVEGFEVVTLQMPPGRAAAGTRVTLETSLPSWTMEAGSRVSLGLEAFDPDGSRVFRRQIEVPPIRDPSPAVSWRSVGDSVSTEASTEVACHKLISQPGPAPDTRRTNAEVTVERRTYGWLLRRVLVPHTGVGEESENAVGTHAPPAHDDHIAGQGRSNMMADRQNADFVLRLVGKLQESVLQAVSSREYGVSDCVLGLDETDARAEPALRVSLTAGSVSVVARVTPRSNEPHFLQTSLFNVGYLQAQRTGLRVEEEKLLRAFVKRIVLWERSLLQRMLEMRGGPS